MTEFKYGIFASFVLFVWKIIEYTLIVPNFYETGSYIGYISLIIPVVGIYLGIKERREKSNFGYIKFAEAFRTGIVISFIMAVSIVFFIYGYFKFINPNYVNYLAAEVEKTLLNRNAARQDINANLDFLKHQFNFYEQIIQQFLIVLLGGIAISFIVSMLLKKHQSREPAS